jgi:hypothetical protein
VTSYFIYYRVAPAMRDTATAVIGELQALIAAATGVQGRVMRKDDASGTWMEIYEGVNDQAGFDTAMSDALQKVQFERLLAADSQRHLERFINATPCA